MFYKPLISITFFSFILFNQGYSKEIKYKVSDIPLNLLDNSKAVIRTMKVDFIVQSTSLATKEVTTAITILNENADNLAYFIDFYDKFRKIININGKVYDKNGELIKRLAALDVLDYSAIQDFSIYEDTRVKFIDPEIRDYPFTVEYSYKIFYNGLIDYPDWEIYPDYNVAVESSEFHLTVPMAQSCRMYYSNLVCNCDSSNNYVSKFYHWKVNNQPAVNIESFSCNLFEFSPVLYLAPDRFEIGGIPGDCKSWKTFGDWINELNKERAIIPSESVEEIKKLVNDSMDLNEKVCTLYKYLQDKTRYANIKIGLGGWQPIDAETVDRLSYGDCKALSNYMMTLLKSVGIKAYYTLVRAGDNAPELISDFPSFQFNHAMLCIPTEEDTIWLECTSQTLPCGFIGTFTEDRDVLVITENGGEIWHTKAYTTDENVQLRKALIQMNTDGSGDANVHTIYSGCNYDKMSWILFTDQADKMKKLYEIIQIPEFKIIDFKYEEQRSKIPVISEKLNLSLRNHSTIIGERMILPVNLMNKYKDLPKRTITRHSDINFRRSYCEIDSITFLLPPGYIVDNIPDPVSISGRFGCYDSNIMTHKNKLLYVRTCKFNKGRYSPSSYNELIDFITSIVIADEMKVLLKKI